MIDWEDLHHAADIIALATFPTAVTGISVLKFVRQMPRLRRGLGWSLVVLATGFYVFDVADRFGAFAPAVPQEAVQDYGLLPGAIPYMIVNPRGLPKQSEKFNLMLLVRVPFANVDPFRDTDIEKSTLYTISDYPITLSLKLSEEFVRRVTATNPMATELNLIMLPVSLVPDQVLNLSDVSRLGGKFVSRRGFTAFMR
jgi:hypothetical protein